MLQTMLVIPHARYEEVIAHCRSRYPKEACGLLGGSRLVPAQGPDRVVAQVYLMTNVEDSPIGYSMDPREQLKVEKAMRGAGQALLGIFHSHTASPAYPSSVDVSLSLGPDVSYVLVSLKDREHPDFKSYRIDGTKVEEEAVRIGGP